MAKRLDYFVIDSAAEALLPTIQADENIASGIRDYLTSLVGCWRSNDRAPFSRAQLQEYLATLNKGSHASLISLRQRELQELSLIEETDDPYLGKAIRVLRVGGVEKLLSHRRAVPARRVPVRRPTKSQIIVDMRSAEDTGTFLPAAYDLQGRVEGLFTGILDAAVRLSGKDKRDLISCTYRLSDTDKIHITTKTLSQSEIMLLSDQRVILALNACFIDYVEAKYGSIDSIPDADRAAIDGLFFFDLFDLCDRIALPPSPRNRELVRRMLERLRDTAFEIDASESAYFRKVYGRDADSIQYRYITEFYAKKQNELFDEGGQIYRHAERFYFVKFHSILVAQLLTRGRSFIAHPDRTKERSGIAHRLNNWCKARIGVRAKPGDNTFRFMMDEFWEVVMPSTRLDNFCRDLISLLHRNRMNPHETGGGETDEANFSSLIYGYFFEISHDKDEIADLMRRRRRRLRPGAKLYPIIKVTRDVNDPYIGDNSDHNQALRRLSADMLA